VFSHILISDCIPFYILFILFFDQLYGIPSGIIALYCRLGSCMFCRKVEFLVQVCSRKVKLSRRHVLTLLVNHEGSKGASTLFKVNFFVVHLFQSTRFRLVDSVKEIGNFAIHRFPFFREFVVNSTSG